MARIAQRNSPAYVIAKEAIRRKLQDARGKAVVIQPAETVEIEGQEFSVYTDRLLTELGAVHEIGYYWRLAERGRVA